MKNNTHGFTLSEILITLGIIGVVAAITLPTVVANYRKKQFQSGLNKSYSILLQALKKYEESNGEQLTQTTCSNTRGCFKQKIQPYLKVAVDCGDSQTTNAKNNEFCHINGEYSGKYTYKTYSGNNNAYESYFDDGQLVLNDGSLLMFENSQGATRVLVSVDINGVQKLPNKWGEDLFTFQLLDNGKLLPMGAEETTYKNLNTYCSQTATNTLNGIACTNMALYDKNFWK